MGGKSSPKAPAAPDYEKLIAQQAQVNRVNQVSPFGNITYSGPDKSTQTVTLSPEMQRIFGGATGMANERMRIDAPAYDRTLSAEKLEDAIYGREMRLLDPQLQQRERALRQNLADRGLVEGSEAYTDALNMELDQANRARSDVALAAVLGGRDAFNQERNYALNRDQVQGQTDQIDFGQLASLLGATPNAPVNPVDVTGSAGLNLQGQMAGYQGKIQQQQNKKGFLGDVLTAGAGLAALSDVRLKQNIRFVERRGGVNWYAWDWKDGSGSEFGVLAQEIVLSHPHAVGIRDGYLTVNYGAL